MTDPIRARLDRTDPPGMCCPAADALRVVLDLAESPSTYCSRTGDKITEWCEEQGCIVAVIYPEQIRRVVSRSLGLSHECD